jgi:MinD superfamily P-loop ATPase
MKQLVVISGKGGTGKTSVVASFAVLAENAVLADCDVDAADLHLVLSPEPLGRQPFSGGKGAAIEPDICTACGHCRELCRFDAITRTDTPDGPIFRVEDTACEGCGVCARFCPAEAIRFEPVENGEWFISRTRCGPMVHARLGIAQENSGKLVSLVRAEARKVAQQNRCDTIIVDGSPGIGCPVIASISGADLALVVTEPTRSGLHDLQRVTDLTAHFNIPTQVVINKWDLNPDICGAIEQESARRNLPVSGRVRYDRQVTAAQIGHRAVVEMDDAPAAMDLRALWQQVAADLNQLEKSE